MTLIRYRKLTYIFSGTLVLLSLIALLVWHLKLGIDFTGGSLIEIEYRSDRPSLDELNKDLVGSGFHTEIQPTEARGVFIRTQSLMEPEHQALLFALSHGDKNLFTEKKFDSIGPTIGAELARKSVYAIFLVILLIVLYIAFVFRKVSEPVASWKYGIATVIALIHDVMIPVGVFTVLGHFFGFEADTLFVTALLTILGFSVHDTIVVFDRIRENLKIGNRNQSFEDIVGRSISQTITRSINTSMTVLLVLFGVYFFGGESVKTFALTLIIGIFFGTYSSIFLASPLLVTWHGLITRRGRRL